MRTPRDQAQLFLLRAKEIELRAKKEPDEQRRETMRELAAYYRHLALPMKSRPQFPKLRDRKIHNATGALAAKNPPDAERSGAIADRLMIELIAADGGEVVRSR